MGANSSSIADLSSNEYLSRLAGPEPIHVQDPFWNSLLSFSFAPPLNSADSRLVEENTVSVCRNLTKHNLDTGNLGSLLRVFFRRASELKATAQSEESGIEGNPTDSLSSSSIFTWQTFNALFIIRSICKYLIEHLSEENVLRQFNVRGPDDDEQHGYVAEELINCLVEIVVDVPVLPATYAIHLETLNTLVTLLSVQMYMLSPKEPSVLYGYLMGRSQSGGKSPSIHAPLFTKTLLLNYIKQEPAPPDLLKTFGQNQGNGLLYGLAAGVASGIWSVVTLGMGTGATPDGDEDPSSAGMKSTALLANQSLHLILILANHSTICSEGFHNPYRQALFSFTNVQGQAVSNPTEAVATFRIDYSKLYDTLAATLGSSSDNGQTTLLLYLLLHRNSNVKEFLLSKTNVEQLVLPVLKILYSAQEQNSHHIYMALIILLVLSEDDFFNNSIHDVQLKYIGWYTERQLSEISLGGLLVLVVIKTIQTNMTRMRDKYLHTNCLACLANMSATFKEIHAYVAQKLISLLQALSKKHAKLVDQIRNSDYGISDKEEEPESNEVEEMVQDLTVLEEVLRMVLEIINSTLTNSLHHNPNLIYTLLYKRETFDAFRAHPMFQDVIQNIDLVLGFFSKRLDAITNTKDGPHNPSVAEVLDCIKQGAQTWPRDRLKKFPELKFKYVEEEEPEEFFVPYIWTLIFHSSNLYWDSDRIQLFNANGNG